MRTCSSFLFFHHLLFFYLVLDSLLSALVDLILDFFCEFGDSGCNLYFASRLYFLNTRLFDNFCDNGLLVSLGFINDDEILLVGLGRSFYFHNFVYEQLLWPIGHFKHFRHFWHFRHFKHLWHLWNF